MSDAMEEIERLVVEAMSAAVAFVKKASEQDTPSLVQVHAQKTAVLAAIRRALEAAPAGAFQRGVEAAAEVLRGVVDSSEEDDRWDAIVAEAESQILDLAHRRPTRSAPGAASPGERGPSLPPQTYEDGFRECRVAAECCVEAEEELSGPMPKAMLSALRERPEDVLRATVRTTKDGILARVQALRPMLAAPVAPPGSSGAEKEEP